MCVDDDTDARDAVERTETPDSASAAESSSAETDSASGRGRAQDRPVAAMIPAHVLVRQERGGGRGDGTKERMRCAGGWSSTFTRRADVPPQEVEEAALRLHDHSSRTRCTCFDGRGDFEALGLLLALAALLLAPARSTTGQ